jgi:LEA14-like dessication related protein
MTRRREFAGLLVAAAVCAAAPGFARPASGQALTSEIKVELREKRVPELTPEGLSINFTLDITNTSALPHSLSRYRYRAYVDETEYIALETPLDEPIPVAARERTAIILPLRITYANLFAAIPGTRSRDQAVCLVVGDMVFQDERRREKRVPFSLSADFPIFRGLDIHILPAEAHSLTIGGADILFKAAIMNPSGFPVTIRSFRYALDLVGKRVSEGTTAAGLAVEGRREKEFSIPLLLDFFNLGRVLYDGLLQPPVSVRIAGAVEMETPWGTFPFRLEKSDKAPVIRKSD